MAASVTIGGQSYTAASFSNLKLAQRQAKIYKLLTDLKTEQTRLWSTYNAARGTQAQTDALDAIKANVANQNLLYSIAAEATVLGATAETTAADYENSRNILSEFARDQLADATANAAELKSANDGKKRMIELNTYYGKRFNAQAGVVKIFIYMCVPVLILAILANASLIPTSIAGFIIVIIIVTGLVYIYAAVNDINRRSKMNFDEYEWEFDPSRVGAVINPKDVTKRHRHQHRTTADDIMCSNGKCCGEHTTWNPASKSCVVQDAQGSGSAVKGENLQKSSASGSAPASASASASASGLLGDLRSL